MPENTPRTDRHPLGMKKEEESILTQKDNLSCMELGFKLNSTFNYFFLL
jgi:hypothetical protein